MRSYCIAPFKVQAVVDNLLISEAYLYIRLFIAKPRETLIKSNSPRSNEHTHAAEFDTLRFNQRVPDIAADLSISPSK